TVAAAQAGLERLLARIDVIANAADAPLQDDAAPLIPVPGDQPSRLDLRAEGIRSVIWATGFNRDYGWLKVPVIDAAGELLHDGGVTPFPGLYVLGLRFMRRRRSNFIDGVGRDAEELTQAVLDHLSWSQRAAA
ncbi:MAG: pyridine nucleotide-disulfide oxidoreductase, partial [Rhodopila sp.]